MAEIEHDRGLIKRLAQMHDGNAGAHMRAAEQHEDTNMPQRGWTEHAMIAASSLVIAASYWSLINAHTAVMRYRRAAEMYRTMGHNYWIVLALASASEEEMARLPFALNDMSVPDPQSVAFLMVGNQVADTDLRGLHAERLEEHWRHAGNIPVGRLGIPLDHYARCAQAMDAAHEGRQPDRFLLQGANYIRRAAEVLHSASHDQYHWLRLQSAILPAEPEAVAMTTAMSRMSHSMFRRSLSESPNLMRNLDRHGRMLAQIGDEMWNAAHGENEH